MLFGCIRCVRVCEKRRRSDDFPPFLSDTPKISAKIRNHHRPSASLTPPHHHMSIAAQPANNKSLNRLSRALPSFLRTSKGRLKDGTAAAGAGGAPAERKGSAGSPRDRKGSASLESSDCTHAVAAASSTAAVAPPSPRSSGAALAASVAAAPTPAPLVAPPERPRLSGSQTAATAGTALTSSGGCVSVALRCCRVGAAAAIRDTPPPL
jgi:hypothetical protein